MGSSHPFLLSPPTLRYLTINPSKTSLNPNFSSQFCCFFSSKPRRGPNSDPFRGDRFGFRQKQRNWWSDDEDDDDDDDDDDDFGFWKEPNAVDWLFKILGTFGWIIPAVIISTVLGNESNSLIMALVLPLGQTALSLVMDKLWVGPSSSPTPRPRTNGRARTPRTGTRPMRKAANRNSSAKKSRESGSEFGGWDELDELSNVGVPKDRSNQMGEEFGKESRDENVKLSTRRKSEKPLFMRLLIAVFPFLGSWSRFLF